MGKARHQAIVLDAGALIAFERADPKMRALLREVTRTGTKLVVPAGVVAQVFRDRARQVPLRALLDAENSNVPELDRPLAEAAGALCGRSGTHDVVDASVVLVAKRERAIILTSDIDDLRALDSSALLERI